LLLTFENGEKRVFDLKPYLEKPVFKSLRNASLFKTARVVSGSVEWQGEVDLSYDTLYVESKPLKEMQRHKVTRGKKKNIAMATVPKKKSPKAPLTAK
jgi:hypothetical protein